jgi:probable rRNA maturation factor
MEIEIRNRQRKVRVDGKRLARLAERALGRLGLEEGQLSVVIVSDRRMAELNRTYRRVDGPTDVLAFAQQEGEGEGFNVHVLGDVVISAESAARQAPRYRRSLEGEMDLLLVHGILHLAGFDHVDSVAEEKKMKAWKTKILRGWDG